MSQSSDNNQNIAGYVRVSTDDQDLQRQINSIEEKYGEDVEIYPDFAKSGANAEREAYQRLQTDIENGEVEVVAAHELDRLGRSFAELASFVEFLREQDVDLDLVNQPVDTRGDDWMGDLALNILIVFADAERKMIKDRVQQGVERAKEEGKHTTKPPFGYTVDDGFLQQKTDEYVKVQEFIREVRKGREKKSTAEFFDIPYSSVNSILERSEKNYDVEFDNSEWRIEREKVRADEKELDPLEN